VLFLNLETGTLHAREWVAATPSQRGTWLAVMLYCASQENGGRLSGADEFSARQWAGMCGVTKRDIAAGGPLLRWDGPDLLVWGYPLAQEQAMRAKRAHAKQILEKRWPRRAHGCGAAEQEGSTNEGGLSADPAAAGNGSATVSGTAPVPSLGAGTIAEPVRAPEQDAERKPERERVQAPVPTPTQEPRPESGREEGKGNWNLAALACAREAERSFPAAIDTEAFRAAWGGWTVHWATTFNRGRPIPMATADAHLLVCAKLGPDRAVVAVENAIARGLREPAGPFPKSLRSNHAIDQTGPVAGSRRASLSGNYTNAGF